MVLSFTRRPTYVLPRRYMESQQPWEADYLTSSLKSRRSVTFPEPPGWSSLPWRPPWEAETEERKLLHDPLNHEWDPGLMTIPCAEPMFFGPGQLSVWPVLDLQDQVQRRTQFKTKYEFERILEDTTVQVLKREYGISAFAIPGAPGIWVESAIPPPEVSEHELSDSPPRDLRPSLLQRRPNTRRIATIHADIVNDITRFGVSIHVGHPEPFANFWRSMSSPWTPLRQGDKTTSIVSELAYRGTCPTYVDPAQESIQERSQRKSKYLMTAFDDDKTPAHLKAMPYSLIQVDGGLRKPAPLGMDNRDLSAAWAFEFARQLGMGNGFVDFYTVKDPGLSGRTFGFIPREVDAEDSYVEPYNQVDVPTIHMREDGLVTREILDDTKRIERKDSRLGAEDENSLAISWPMYYDQLTKVLGASIKGYFQDTRWYHLLREKRHNEKEERRLQLIEDIQDPQRKWLGGSLNELRKGPPANSVVEKLAKTTVEMQAILRQLELGGEWKRRLFNSTVQMRKLLQSRLSVVRSVAIGAELDDEAREVTETTEVAGRMITCQTDETTEGDKDVWIQRVEEEVRFVEESLQAATDMLESYDAPKQMHQAPEKQTRPSPPALNRQPRSLRSWTPSSASSEITGGDLTRPPGKSHQSIPSASTTAAEPTTKAAEPATKAEQRVTLRSTTKSPGGKRVEFTPTIKERFAKRSREAAGFRLGTQPPLSPKQPPRKFTPTRDERITKMRKLEEPKSKRSPREPPHKFTPTRREKTMGKQKLEETTSRPSFKNTSLRRLVREEQESKRPVSWKEKKAAAARQSTEPLSEFLPGRQQIVHSK